MDAVPNNDSDDRRRVWQTGDDIELFRFRVEFAADLALTASEAPDQAIT